jgi:hypothetical protein
MPNAIASGMATLDETSSARMSLRTAATPGFGARDEAGVEFMRFTCSGSGGIARGRGRLQAIAEQQQPDRGFSAVLS